MSKKANSILSCTTKNFFLSLCSLLLREYLECCVQICGPGYKRNVDILEQVQQKCTRMIKWQNNFSHENRLKEWSLFSLEKRVLRGILSLCLNVHWEWKSWFYCEEDWTLQQVTPEALQILSPWNYSKQYWIWPWATQHSWLCFGQEGSDCCIWCHSMIPF